jgi:hypothetical protein
MKKLFAWHNRQIDWWKDKLNLSWYGVAWISFFKGVILTILVAYLI